MGGEFDLNGVYEGTYRTKLITIADGGDATACSWGTIVPLRPPCFSSGQSCSAIVAHCYITEHGQLVDR